MLKTGYKLTEIGLIPEDWEVKDLGGVLLSNPDYGINAAAVKYDDTLPTYLRITDIDDNGRFIKDNLSSVDDLNSSKYYLNENEIVFARTGASVGKTYLYNRKDGDLVFAGFLIRTKVNTDKAHSKFIFYNTQTKYYENWIISNSMRSGQPGINSNEIKSLQIPLPTLSEQEAIASALSDTDAWIKSLEQLIAKKRFIKQGAMQTLLTPKEDWEVKKLGEVLKFGSGRDYKHLNGGAIPVYGTGGVMTFVDNYLHDGISVGIGRKGTIDKPVLLSGKFWTVDTLFYTHSFNRVNPNYIYYQFLLIPWREYNEASGVPSLNKNTLEEIEICLPSLSEQERIATILSEMDTEIEALQNKLTKARQIKQGMMQELLTGRIRLV
ncbi:restriction endonuclease subunit S [Sphingobacteriaceae bacterium WQ 2009]|uniref:Restriction endonuclease subunit S n=1 Tax=Rhinopithecimicrobium faecis TaxID=2820698 RepID=A0A8T4HGR8_9SPHI|nr:restriction endonuclease subunit S [Sphingobacteriaceae bacterium WQ 2009]